VMPADPKTWLVQRARDLAVGINPLFHGTRYPDEILMSGMLKAASIGDACVCFSRSPEEAAFWATLEREDDEGRGAVFVFDRDRLLTRYRLDPVNCSIDRDEHEERVWDRDVTLTSGLIGIASQPIPTRCREQRRRAWNDITAFRASFNGKRVGFTRAVAALGPEVQQEILEAFSRYEDCDARDDPSSERDHALIAVQGHQILIKIDCYDRDLVRRPASDPNVVHRIRSVMLADGHLPVPTKPSRRSGAIGALVPA
jgi:hypothetical protein